MGTNASKNTFQFIPLARGNEKRNKTRDKDESQFGEKHEKTSNLPPNTPNHATKTGENNPNATITKYSWKIAETTTTATVRTLRGRWKTYRHKNVEYARWEMIWKNLVQIFVDVGVQPIMHNHVPRSPECSSRREIPPILVIRTISTRSLSSQWLTS